jgi:hypothetical protein
MLGNLTRGHATLPLIAFSTIRLWTRRRRSSDNFDASEHAPSVIGRPGKSRRTGNQLSRERAPPSLKVCIHAGETEPRTDLFPLAANQF